MRARISITGSVFLLLFPALTMAPACRPPAAPPSPQRAAELAPAARHAIHSEGLQRIMNTLGTQVVRTWPQEIEPERRELARERRERQFEHAGHLAAALARTAERIPGAVADVPLTDPQRQSFINHVEDLQFHSSRLADAAAARNLDLMDAALVNVEATCNRCHQQFREYAGPVELGRPSS